MMPATCTAHQVTGIERCAATCECTNQTNIAILFQDCSYKSRVEVMDDVSFIDAVDYINAACPT
eukprot:SAG31_NODE_44795_length_261_cov_0.641975_1_plen_63_part_10